MQRPRLRLSVRSSRPWPLCETSHTRFTWRATLGSYTKARMATNNNNPELLRDLLDRIAYKLRIKDVFLSPFLACSLTFFCFSLKIGIGRHAAQSRITEESASFAISLPSVPPCKPCVQSANGMKLASKGPECIGQILM